MERVALDRGRFDIIREELMQLPPNLRLRRFIVLMREHFAEIGAV